MKKEITEKYIRVYGTMWGEVDKKIKNLIMLHSSEKENLLEIGFGSGHYLASLFEEDRIMTGVEIRKEAFQDVQKKFELEYPEIKLLYGDALSISGKYDLIYSTGLIQCLKIDKRKELLTHLAKMSDKVIYTVPKIDEIRNSNSKKPIGVGGCEEYETGNLAYELSTLYSYVEMGIWKKDEIDLSDDFIWFYCDGARALEVEK